MKRETAQRHSLKIIAIFFAVSLWFYVLNSEPVQIERKLSINYIIPKGYTIASLNEKEVTIKVKGSKAFIQNIFSNKEKLNVDLNPYFVSSGKSFKVKFYASDISVPFGAEIVDISPKETSIELDRMVMLEMPVKVEYIGDSPRDRKIKEVIINPRSIRISGPIEILKSVSRVETAPVNLALFNKDEGSTTVSLVDLDPRLKFEETPKVKITYKTQLLTLKKNSKKDL
ncbi:MAG: CdaR family protein [Bacteriovorax sp.]|jgi:YbbR domain-containing protein